MWEAVYYLNDNLQKAAKNILHTKAIIKDAKYKREIFGRELRYICRCDPTINNETYAERGSIFTYYKSSPVFSVLLVRTITKTRLYNFDPLKPHFFIVKLGFTGVYIIFFFISAQKHRLWVLVRTTIYIFYMKMFIFFLVVKFSVYLNRHVFVMRSESASLAILNAPSEDNVPSDISVQKDSDQTAHACSLI